MEKIVAYRTFGVAETFLGYQVNASTAACFTCSLNYVYCSLVQLKPPVTADRSENRSILEEFSIEARMQRDAYHFTGYTSVIELRKL